MSSATGVKALFISPVVIYPVALISMAFHGWWTNNLEAMFAAPITALLFTLVDYPIAVTTLWCVRRLGHARGTQFQVMACVALALAMHFALVWPLGLFRFSGVFTAFVVGVTALSWATIATNASRRPVSSVS